MLATDYASDTDGTRTASPPRNMDINNLLNDDTPSVSSAAPARRGPGRGNWGHKNRHDGSMPGSRSFKPKREHSADGVSSRGGLPSGPHGFYIPLNGEPPVHKRHRPQTQHQMAVEQYRRNRVDCVLDGRLRMHYKVAKKHRCRDGAMARAWLRCKMMPDGYDTDEDMAVRNLVEEQHVLSAQIASMSGDADKRGLPGFVGLLPMPMEPLDYGEEAHARLQVMRRIERRLERWEDGRQPVRVGRDKHGQWREGQVPPSMLKSGESKMNSLKGGGRARRREMESEMRLQDDAMEQDRDEMEGVIEGDVAAAEDVGAAGEDEELDDADREMLGEVDADESEED